MHKSLKQLEYGEANVLIRKRWEGTPVIEQFTSNWKGAVITLTSKADGFVMVRPAVFLFDHPGGLAWLEPSYADPWGAASPAWHEIAAPSIVAHDSIIEFDGPVYSGDIEPDFGQNASARDALAWFAEWMDERGLSWAEERARIVKLELDRDA